MLPEKLTRRRFTARVTSGAAGLTAASAVSSQAGERQGKEGLEVGGQLQLFLDDWLIKRLTGLELKLHSPRPAEVVLRRDRPWEDAYMYDPAVMKDGSRYRMWYRTNLGWVKPIRKDVRNVPPPFYTGYAESKDGVHWVTPSLGLIEFAGSKDNNLVWSSAPDRRGGYVLSVFKDGNPKAPDSQRYKAIAIGWRAVGPTRDGMFGLVSADGLRWQKIQAAPIIPGPKGDGYFDSFNIAFWDAPRNQYVAYLRGARQGKRGIRRGVSADFRNWSDLQLIDLGKSPAEHLYKNSATPYYRRPDILLMFPKRFIPERKFDAAWYQTGISDIVFMSSRDGLRWDRRFMEAFLRPGPDPLNWHDRAIEAGPNLVPTGPGEMSLYYMEHYGSDSVQIRRGVLREDGLVSVHGGFSGGEMLTKNFVFTGRRLVLNYATSAAGSLRVELQDRTGKPIPGRTLGDGLEIYGDEPARVVAWKGGNDMSNWAGQPIRLRFVLKDADLYALRFQGPGRE